MFCVIFKICFVILLKILYLNFLLVLLLFSIFFYINMF